MAQITDERVLELARKSFADCAGVFAPTDGQVLAFAAALLAEHEGRRIAELVSVRAALEGAAT
jgi:hypothetical protein